jgi:peptidoglycan/xylan/chitin deacetylase (PgdA/CDA1 family)
LVNLVVDEMWEGSEDSGGVIRVNADFDEQNKNKEGNPLSDYQPDEKEGHRIVGDDPNLKDASLKIRGEAGAGRGGSFPGKGRWRLIFPENVRVWEKIDDSSHAEIISSRFSETVGLPFFCELKIEGIKGSQAANDVRISAEFVPTGSETSCADSVFLTVLDTKFALTFDDGPTPEKTEKIVRTLGKFYSGGEPVRAAFFQIAAKIHKFPDLTRFVDSNGHLVFNRALALERRARARMTARDIDFFNDTATTEIYTALGRKPERIIRGRYSKEGDRFEREAGKAGATVCGGELVFDFRAATVEVVRGKAEEILKAWNTRENPQLHPYPAILIFHEFPEVTHNYIGEIVSYLQDRGFMLVNFDLELAY